MVFHSACLQEGVINLYIYQYLALCVCVACNGCGVLCVTAMVRSLEFFSEVSSICLAAPGPVPPLPGGMTTGTTQQVAWQTQLFGCLCVCVCLSACVLLMSHRLLSIHWLIFIQLVV